MLQFISSRKILLFLLNCNEFTSFPFPKTSSQVRSHSKKYSPTSMEDFCFSDLFVHCQFSSKDAHFQFQNHNLLLVVHNFILQPIKLDRTLDQQVLILFLIIQKFISGICTEFLELLNYLVPSSTSMLWQLKIPNLDPFSCI